MLSVFGRCRADSKLQSVFGFRKLCFACFRRILAWMGKLNGVVPENGCRVLFERSIKIVNNRQRGNWGDRYLSQENGFERI